MEVVVVVICCHGLRALEKVALDHDHIGDLKGIRLTRLRRDDQILNTAADVQRKGPVSINVETSRLFEFDVLLICSAIDCVLS